MAGSSGRTSYPAMHGAPDRCHSGRFRTKKGYLKHQYDGPRYMYSATVSPAVAKRTALQQYLQTFFGGSLRQMMTALVAEASWTDDDLDALKDEIDRVRKERKM
jgi:BlaI family penicillinase repressor